MISFKITQEKVRNNPILSIFTDNNAIQLIKHIISITRTQYTYIYISRNMSTFLQSSVQCCANLMYHVILQICFPNDSTFRPGIFENAILREQLIQKAHPVGQILRYSKLQIAKNAKFVSIYLINLVPSFEWWFWCIYKTYFWRENENGCGRVFKNFRPFVLFVIALCNTNYSCNKFHNNVTFYNI